MTNAHVCFLLHPHLPSYVTATLRYIPYRLREMRRVEFFALLLLSLPPSVKALALAHPNGHQAVTVRLAMPGANDGPGEGGFGGGGPRRGSGSAGGEADLVTLEERKLEAGEQTAAQASMRATAAQQVANVIQQNGIELSEENAKEAQRALLEARGNLAMKEEQDRHRATEARVNADREESAAEKEEGALEDEKAELRGKELQLETAGKMLDAQMESENASNAAAKYRQKLHEKTAVEGALAAANEAESGADQALAPTSPNLRIKELESCLAEDEHEMAQSDQPSGEESGEHYLEHSLGKGGETRQAEGMAASPLAPAISPGEEMDALEHIDCVPSVNDAELKKALHDKVGIDESEAETDADDAIHAHAH